MTPVVHPDRSYASSHSVAISPSVSPLMAFMLPVPLFPQMLTIAMRFIDERVDVGKDAFKQDLAINPYFDKAVRSILNAMRVVSEDGASQERPVIPRGPSGMRTTATVDFHTGKPIDEQFVTKCHLNAPVFDSDWERQAAALLDDHADVRAWVKNDRLGLAVPYRKDGVAKRHFPDFIIDDERWQHR